MKSLNLAILVAALLILISGSASGADLTVEVLEEDNILLQEEEKAALFTLKITNNEPSADSFQIYSIVGVSIFPKERFTIGPGETIELEIEAVPHIETRKREIGDFNFQYEIKGSWSGFFNGVLTLKFRDVEDIINVSVNNINLDDQKARFTITNLEDVRIENLQLMVKSKFFEFSDEVELNEFEQKEFEAPIKYDQIQGLSAGEYEVEISFKLGDKKATKSTTLNYLEKGGISVSSKSEGLIVRKKQVIKTNEGNINGIAIIIVKKDVLSRLFTTFSELPFSVERKGLFVEYLWEREIKPAESYAITVTTNYTIPFIILIVLILIIIIVRFLLMKPLILQKRVSLVKTKGGELALKIRLRVRARKNLQELKIVDRLPRMTKLYNKFGAKPDHIDPKSRKISWNIRNLNAGEERVFTYIIYSKISIIGRFELPVAHARYKIDDKHQDVYSNKTAFAAETFEEKIP